MTLDFLEYSDLFFDGVKYKITSGKSPFSLLISHVSQHREEL